MKRNLEEVYHKYSSISLIAVLIVYGAQLIINKELENYHIYIFVSVSIIIIFSKVYNYYSKKKVAQFKTEKENELENFKNNSDKIIVPLNDLKIKANSWTERKIINEGKYYEEVIENGINLNNIEFNIPYEGQNIKHNLEINMDRKELEIHLAIKKNTFIYINPNDIKDYHLELDFLYEE